MGIMVYSLLWVMQDLHHQPYEQKPLLRKKLPRRECLLLESVGFRVSGFRVQGLGFRVQGSDDVDLHKFRGYTSHPGSDIVL